MKYIYLLLILGAMMCLQPAANAQNTGFGGKRVLLKTDLLNGARSPFVNATAELLVTRRLSLSVGGRMTTGKYNQIYFYDEYLGGQPDQGDQSRSRNRLADKAIVKSRTLMLEARLYTGGVLPAPRGSFFYLGYNYGKVDVQGNYYQSLTTSNGGSSYSYSSMSFNNLYYSYEAKDVLAWGLELGYGYQSFVNKFLSLGFKLGLNKTFFNADGKYEPKELSGVAKTYGPNLLRLSPLGGVDDLSPMGILSSSEDKSYYQGSFGLAFYFQIGILLF